jgi:hypothetical protein
MNKNNFVVGLIIASCLLLGWCTFSLSHPAKVNFLFFDDAFYYLDIVKTGSPFNLTSDGVSHTNGFHPLWLFVLFAVHYLSICTLNGPALSIVSASLVLLLGYVVWYRVFASLHDGPWAPVWFALLTIFYPAMFLMSMSGMESALVMLALGFFFYKLYQYLSAETGSAVDITIASILLFLTRTDMILLIGGVLLYLVLSKGKPWHWMKTPVIGTSIAVLVYLCWNKLMTGSFMQTSGQVYASIKWNEILSSPDVLSSLWHELWFSIKTTVTYMSEWYGSILLFILPFLFIIINDKKKSIGFHLICAMAVGFVLVTLFSSVLRLGPQPWYTPLSFAVFLLALYRFLTLDRRLEPKLATTVTTVLVVALVVTSLIRIPDGLLFNVWHKRYRAQDQLVAIEQVTKQLPNYKGRFGAFNSGEAGYYNPQVVNLDGLSNTDVWNAYQEGKGLQYLREHNVDILVDVPVYFRIFSRYIPLSQLTYIGSVSTEPNSQPAAVYIVKDSKTDSTMVYH